MYQTIDVEKEFSFNLPAFLPACLLIMALHCPQIVFAQQHFDWVPVNDGMEGDQVDVLWRSPSGAFFAGGGTSGLFRAESLGARWKPTDLYDGHVGAITADSSGNLLAGTHIGLYASEDDGLTWTASNLDKRVYTLAVTPNGNAFAGAHDGVYRRLAGDKDWELVGQWDLGGDCINTFDQSPSPICDITVLEDSTLVVAVGGTLLKTQDGDSWQCFIQLDDQSCFKFVDFISLRDDYVSDLQAVGNDVLVSAEDVCSLFLYRSAEDSFTSLGFGGGVFDHAFSNESIYISTSGSSSPTCLSNSGIYRSGNNGQSWSLVSDEHRAFSLVTAPDDSWLCAGIGNGVTCSHDGGLNWELWNEGLTNTEVEGLFFTASGELLAGTLEGKIFKNDISPHWEPLNLAIPDDYVCTRSPRDFTQEGSGKIFTTLDDGGRSRSVYKTDDASSLWELTLAEQPGKKPLNQDDNTTSKPGYLLVCGSRAPNDLYKGPYCPSKVSGGSGLLAINGTAYHFSLAGVLRTDDEFDTKYFVEDGAPTNLTAVVAALAPDSTIYAGGYNGVIRFSDLESWQTILHDEIRILDITITSTGDVLLATDRGVYRSSDRGASWEISFESECFNAIASSHNDVVIAGESHYSLDGGVTWDSVSNQVPGDVISLAFDSNGVLYAGTRGWGVYRTTSPVGVHSDPSENTPTFTARIYPNPVYTQAQLEIELPQPQQVKVDVFDVLGRLRMNLSNGSYPAGRHQLSIDPARLEPGLYIVRIATNVEHKYIPLTKH